MIISNNNTFQYNNIEPFNKLIGGTNNSQKISNPDKHETDLVKIYLKIYIRLFLYIQFKLNKKFNNSIKSKTNVMKQQTLIDSMQKYKEDMNMQRYLQSTDLFFIRPLFESMCKDNFDDICIKYFNSFLKNTTDNNPIAVNEFLEKILDKYHNLIQDYQKLTDNENYRAIINYAKSLNGKLNEEQFLELLKKIEQHVADITGKKTSSTLSTNTQVSTTSTQVSTTSPQVYTTSSEDPTTSKNTKAGKPKPKSDSEFLMKELIKEEIGDLKTKNEDNQRKIEELLKESIKVSGDSLDNLSQKIQQLDQKFKPFIDDFEKNKEEIKRHNDEQIDKIQKQLQQYYDDYSNLSQQFKTKIDTDYANKIELDQKLSELRKTRQPDIDDLNSRATIIQQIIDNTRDTTPFTQNKLDDMLKIINSIFTKPDLDNNSKQILLEIKTELDTFIKTLQKNINSQLDKFQLIKINSEELFKPYLQLVKEIHGAMDIRSKEDRESAKQERQTTEERTIEEREKTLQSSKEERQITEQRSIEERQKTEERAIQEREANAERLKLFTKEQTDLLQKSEERAKSERENLTGKLYENLEQVSKVQNDEITFLRDEVYKSNSKRNDKFDQELEQVSSKIDNLQTNITAVKDDMSKITPSKEFTNELYQKLTEQSKILTETLIEKLTEKLDSSSNQTEIDALKKEIETLKNTLETNEKNNQTQIKQIFELIEKNKVTLPPEKIAQFDKMLENYNKTILENEHKIDTNQREVTSKLELLEQKLLSEFTEKLSKEEVARTNELSQERNTRQKLISDKELQFTRELLEKEKIFSEQIIKLQKDLKFTNKDAKKEFEQLKKLHDEQKKNLTNLEKDFKKQQEKIVQEQKKLLKEQITELEKKSKEEKKELEEKLKLELKSNNEDQKKLLEDQITELEKKSKEEKKELEQTLKTNNSDLINKLFNDYGVENNDKIKKLQTELETKIDKISNLQQKFKDVLPKIHKYIHDNSDKLETKLISKFDQLFKTNNDALQEINNKNQQEISSLKNKLQETIEKSNTNFSQLETKLQGFNTEILQKFQANKDETDKRIGETHEELKKFITETELKNNNDFTTKYNQLQQFIEQKSTETATANDELQRKLVETHKLSEAQTTKINQVEQSISSIKQEIQGQVSGLSEQSNKLQELYI